MRPAAGGCVWTGPGARGEGSGGQGSIRDSGMFSPPPPQQLMERLKRIVKLPHRLRPVQSSKVSGPAHRRHTDTRLVKNVELVKDTVLHLVYVCSP